MSHLLIISVFFAVFFTIYLSVHLLVFKDYSIINIKFKLRNTFLKNIILIVFIVPTFSTLFFIFENKNQQKRINNFFP